MLKRPEYIDIHAHVNFVAYDSDRENLIQKTLEEDTWMINVGTQKDTSQKAVEIANAYPKGVYAIVGLHPVHTSKSFHDESELGEGGKEFTSRGDDFDVDFYRDLASQPKVVALGEAGLDYFHSEPTAIKKQKEIFLAHIELANELKKPLMLHIRAGKKESGAYRDAHEILKAHCQVPCHVHFFAGTEEDAKLFLDLGATLSFTGVITFTKDYDDLVRYIPLDRMMSETDCPYVTPAPYRGTRNEPLHVKEVVKKIALLKGEDIREVKKVLVDNAFSIFSF